MVENLEDIGSSRVDLTSLDFPDKVSLKEKGFNFTLGFTSPIGLWKGSVTICPVGKFQLCNGGLLVLLCNDIYAPTDPPQLGNEDSKQIDGNFTAGTYISQCQFYDHSEPGTYEFTVQLTDYARNTYSYLPQMIRDKGLSTTIQITD